MATLKWRWGRTFFARNLTRIATGRFQRSLVEREDRARVRVVADALRGNRSWPRSSCRSCCADVALRPASSTGPARRRCAATRCRISAAWPSQSPPWRSGRSVAMSPWTSWSWRSRRSGSSSSACSTTCCTSTAAPPRRRVAAAVAVMAVGVRAEPFGNARRSTSSVTMVWIVGVTNALNLLDNMDGLAAGVAGAAAVGVFTLAAILGQEWIATASVALAGACCGLPDPQLAPGLDLHGGRRVAVPRVRPLDRGARTPTRRRSAAQPAGARPLPGPPGPRHHRRCRSPASAGVGRC